MRRESVWKLVRIGLTALHLMVGWLLFTGSLDPYSLGLGALFSMAVASFTYGLFIEEHEAARRAVLPRVGRLLAYLAVTVWQVYAASARVAVMVISGRIRPRIVHFRTRLASDVARAALAASITLTPGTVALDLDEDHLIVHWLDAPTTHGRRAWSLVAEPFERRLRRIWV